MCALRATSRASARQEGTTAVTETDRPRISVVNDNPDFLELMSAILDEDAGYDVSLFDGEKTSIAELVASDPALVIVDLVLGGASGWEIVTLTRAEPKLAERPIIICSADVTALRDRAGELERIGNVHILEKPFSLDQITDVVERLIGRGAPVAG
jgi:DNA-binding response OmpR family regulator